LKGGRGEHANEAIFLHRFERHAVVWQFLWYRGKDGWLLSNISYTDQLPQLFR
jgi:hypothetical protein